MLPEPFLIKVNGNGVGAASAVLLSHAKRNSPSPGVGISFADIGCGTGGWSIALAEQFPNATIQALDRDLSSFGRGHAAPPTNITVQEHDIRRGLPFPDGFFELTMFNMVAPTLADDELAFVCKEIGRITKSPGSVFVSNTHHELAALIGDCGSLASTKTLERETDVREDPYSLEQFLRGEFVLPAMLRAAGLFPARVLDFQPPDNFLSRFQEESKRRGGSPFSCPSIRSYICLKPREPRANEAGSTHG